VTKFSTSFGGNPKLMTGNPNFGDLDTAEIAIIAL
jgi:hypothetical protein